MPTRGYALIDSETNKIFIDLVSLWAPRAFAIKTLAYTLVATDDIILADPTSGAFNITLPSAIGLVGKTYTIKCVSLSHNTVNIVTSLSQTIFIVVIVSSLLLKVGNSVTVVSDGNNWVAISFWPLTSNRDED